MSATENKGAGTQGQGEDLLEPEPQKQELLEQEPQKQELTEKEPQKQELLEQEPQKQELTEQEPQKQQLTEQEPQKQVLTEQEPQKQVLTEQEPQKQELTGQELQKQELTGHEAQKQELTEKEDTVQCKEISTTDLRSLVMELQMPAQTTVNIPKAGTPSATEAAEYGENVPQTSTVKPVLEAGELEVTNAGLQESQDEETARAIDEPTDAVDPSRVQLYPQEYSRQLLKLAYVLVHFEKTGIDTQDLMSIVFRKHKQDLDIINGIQTFQNDGRTKEYEDPLPGESVAPKSSRIPQSWLNQDGNLIQCKYSFSDVLSAHSHLITTTGASGRTQQRLLKLQQSAVLQMFKDLTESAKNYIAAIFSRPLMALSIDHNKTWYCCILTTKSPQNSLVLAIIHTKTVTYRTVMLPPGASVDLCEKTFRQLMSGATKPQDICLVFPTDLEVLGDRMQKHCFNVQYLVTDEGPEHDLFTANLISAINYLNTINAEDWHGFLAKNTATQGSYLVFED